MIHGEHIAPCLQQQCELTDVDGAGIDSYLENLGICPDCVHGVMSAYVLGAGERDWTSDDGIHPIEHAMGVGFLRGITVGVILGREHPV